MNKKEAKRMKTAQPVRTDDRMLLTRALCSWSGSDRQAIEILNHVRALVHGDHQQRPRTLSSRRRRALTGLMPAPDAAFDSRHYAAPATLNSPALAGRWSLLHSEPLPDTVKALAWTEGLLDRYAVVTRNVAVTEHFPGGFAALQPVLRGMEDSGRVVRGRFILGLGAAQFADRATVDRLRELAEITSTAAPAVAVSAVDPASPYGTILPWPSHPTRVRPARRTGAFVVISGGHLVLYLQQGGKQLFTYLEPDGPEQTEAMAAALTALSKALGRDRRYRFTLELVNGNPVRHSHLVPALKAVGFSSVPKGLYWGN
ncbi:Lhr family helicase [Klebsiella pneumoniae]|nr:MULTISPECIES: ATP-dependent helicase [Klebsiella]HCM4296370.1 ATP-dependent helicase [Klebsiella quasipneumoniae subsp. quasipneumoniae]MCV0446204.1 ATP-dependent helicase [Klebsiella pneumoniae]MDF9957648.1 ATP-dependent helicase [Klebsiella pneumoniae]MDW1479868.1 ATP-dependent helicase [Klebsiella pneumoniae]MDZ0793961.1 ATP-dependent helicase [Klebsiella quasipneumoniae]